MRMKLPEKNCINCKHFAWWDGDYCCTDKFKILQASPKGQFNADIEYALEKNKNCKKWKAGNPKIVEMYLKAYNEYIKGINENL